MRTVKTTWGFLRLSYCTQDMARDAAVVLIHLLACVWSTTGELTQDLPYRE